MENIKQQVMTKARLEHELPVSTEEWGWKYHHLGIPTQFVMPGEIYVSQFRFFVSGFNTSPFGIEWMRFESDSPIDILIQKVPHLAFVVDNLDWELGNRDFKILTRPNNPAKGIRVAMIEHNGAPIELIEFEKNPKV